MGSWLTSLRTAGADFVVHVKTGDRKGAGTDANVYLRLHDDSGNVSDEILLDAYFHNDHERGESTSYGIWAAKHLRNVFKVEFRRDSYGFGDNWHLDFIQVDDKRRGTTHTFPVHRWIKPDFNYFVPEFDSCLPEFDERREERMFELAEKKRMYEYVMNVVNGPVQVKLLPDDETFSDSYKWDIGTQKLKLIAHSTLIKLQTDAYWESLDDLKSIYRFSLGEPQCMTHWKDDWWFGIQRLQGCNPVLIRLCEEIPDKFGVTDEMMRPILDGMTLDEAIKKKKLFIVDMKLLHELKCKENRVMCTPIALFYLNKEQTFLPVAIQLFQNKAPDNPVFLPTDPPYTWLLAKMYYNNADAMYHQSLTHLGFTHLMMEGVVVCTHRNLSPSHPLFRLMAPHFLFLLAINTRGLEKLVSPGGWVDKTMTGGRDGMFNLIVRGFELWHMNVQGCLPQEIASRKVDDPKVLPYYPYRDDAVPIFEAIRRYVTKVVNYYYDTPLKIQNDYELHAWRRELVRDRYNCGLGLHGVPGDDVNGFTTVDEIIETVTSIIATCSIGHSAANFQQYDEYAFLPNYPGILIGDIPKTKEPLTERDILCRLPNKDITLDTMVITKLLSSKGTKSLGDFEVQYLFDPVSLQAAKEFREELARLSDEVKLRNETRVFPFPWLDPEIIPNSISI
ncbi:hypothetical protein CHUAL_013326 [Chamberlinius hualienensis]